MFNYRVNIFHVVDAKHCSRTIICSSIGTLNSFYEEEEEEKKIITLTQLLLLYLHMLIVVHVCAPTTNEI